MVDPLCVRSRHVVELVFTRMMCDHAGQGGRGRALHAAASSAATPASKSASSSVLSMCQHWPSNHAAQQQESTSNVRCAGGKLARRQIVASYKAGGLIATTVQITNNHWG